MDISNMFFAIELSEPSMHFFNFYYGEKILMHHRLAQRWCSSPNIAQQAMDRTFADHVLKDFIKIKNLNEYEQFPYTKYDNFMRVFVDNILVFSKENLKKKHIFYA